MKMVGSLPRGGVVGRFEPGVYHHHLNLTLTVFDTAVSLPAVSMAVTVMVFAPYFRERF